MLHVRRKSWWRCSHEIGSSHGVIIVRRRRPSYSRYCELLWRWLNLLLLGRRFCLWQYLLQLFYLLLVNISTCFEMIQEGWVTQQSFHSIQSSLIEHRLVSTSTHTIIITAVV